MPQAHQSNATVHGVYSRGAHMRGALADQTTVPILMAHSDAGVLDAGTLENVELLMALEAQNLVGSGFEASVRRAAETIGAEFLFNIPAPSSMPFQRAALVSLPDENAELVLVTLSADGSTMDAQVESPETAHLFRLGEAWLAVVSQFRKLS